MSDNPDVTRETDRPGPLVVNVNPPHTFSFSVESDWRGIVTRATLRFVWDRLSEQPAQLDGLRNAALDRRPVRVADDSRFGAVLFLIEEFILSFDARRGLYEMRFEGKANA